jgi:glycosyltransferase involved in cell wall biosynthesis
MVSTLNSWYLSEYGGRLKGKIYMAIDLLTNWKVDRYLVVSETIKKSLVMTGVADSSVDVIRNAVEVDSNSKSLDPKQFREEWGLPQEAILCVAVGRLVWAKGFDDLITSFAAVANEIPDIYLMIVGGGELFSTLTDQIAQAGLQNRIFLLGYRDHEWVQRMLGCADMFVMSSRSEGVPFALLEAAAVGLPTVATNCGGIPEVVKDRVEALLVPAGDVTALSTAIIELCNNKEFANELGRNVKEKIKTDYSLASQLAAMKQAYLKALNHKRIKE